MDNISDKRLIVALDFHTIDRVKETVERLGDSVSYYKIGMELFYSVGVEVIQYLRELGKDIFLDLKMHDIPNTVANSTSVLTRLGVSMLNVHAAGGLLMMQTAAQAVADAAQSANLPKPKLIAVTILTSIDEAEWVALNFGSKLSDQVINLAQLAKEAGLDGVVASPQEAAMIRRACGEQFAIITPGIRPQGAALNDQSRTATPAGALAAGAHYLVVGRPITAADNPKEAAAKIVREMRGLDG